jgi:hypothetical protein
MQRYLIARELSDRRDVLDIACGEGYGSDILATVAAHVVGVDIAADVVAHAASRYARPNLAFKHGACEEIPLPDHSVDLVVSFETIEHIPVHEDMMREIRRVLRADGLLVISTPERHEYSDVTGYRNPYHVKELDRREFEHLMRSHFQHVAVAGQRIRGGSIVGPLDESTNTSFVTFPVAGADVNRVQGLHAPVYLLALACDKPLQALPIGLLDGGEFAWASDLANLLSQVQGRCAVEIARRFGEVLQLDGATPEVMQAEFDRQADRVSEVTRLLAVQQEILQGAERIELASRDRDRESQARLATAQQHLAELRAQIDLYEQSRSWRLTAPFRAVRRFLGAAAPHR